MVLGKARRSASWMQHMQGKPRLILETQQFETCTRSGDEFPILVPIEVREWCGFPERPAVQEAKSIAQVVGAQVRIIVVGQSHQGQLVGVAAVMQTGDQFEGPKAEEIMSHVIQVP